MGIMNAKNYVGHKLGAKVKIKTDTGPGGAKQEFREECDINYIVKRFAATGEMPVNRQSLQPVFADVSAIGDFGSALRRVTAAQEAFAELPADLRSKFGNSPENLVSFIQNEANYDEAVKLGLIEKKAAPTEAAVTPVIPAITPKA